MKELLEDVVRRIVAYQASVDERSVAPDAGALKALQGFDEPLQDETLQPSEVLARLDGLGSPATVASTGGRYFGFVIGGAQPAALAAHLLATAWDQNSGLHACAPPTAYLEEIARRWLASIFGLPADVGAGFVTGGSMANFAALAAARHAVLERQGWDVERDGLFGAPPISVIVGDEAHSSIPKALGMLGLGRARLIGVPTDSQGRMRPDSLPILRGPAIICTQAGNVNTGAFDPVGEICERLEGSGAWVHVDGAFGLWARACPSRAHLAEGVEKADSWSTDAHKWLNTPYDCGVVLLRDVLQLKAAMATSAAYLVQGDDREPCHYAPELSRRARGVDVWAALKAMGRSGIAELVERNCRQAARFAEGLSAAGYEVLNDVVLNQVLVSFGDSDTTRRVIRGIQEEGTCWCGGTEWQGRTAMRISVSSWRTTDEDVERSLDAMVRVARNETGRDREAC